MIKWWLVIMYYAVRVPINSLYAKSTLINYRNTDEKYDIHSEDIASGFFYTDESDQDYLVTNKHVVVDKADTPIDTIDILINKSEEVSDTKRKSVKLLKNGKSKWVSHSEADIAAIPLEFNLDQTGSLSYTKSDILPRNAIYNGRRIVSGGESSSIVGFPLGLIGENKVPVIRDAVISTPYGVSFDDQSCFLVDARLQPGMSGSPVLSEIKKAQFGFNEEALSPEKEAEAHSKVVGMKEQHLLGVFSETVIPQFRRKRGNDLLEKNVSEEIIKIRNHLSDIEERLETELDLHRVWYADLIYDMLSNK